jgi:hypothetical protein
LLLRRSLFVTIGDGFLLFPLFATAQEAHGRGSGLAGVKNAEAKPSPGKARDLLLFQQMADPVFVIDSVSLRKCATARRRRRSSLSSPST